MSRTYRIDRYQDYKKVPEGKQWKKNVGCSPSCIICNPDILKKPKLKKILDKEMVIQLNEYYQYREAS